MTLLLYRLNTNSINFICIGDGESESSDEETDNTTTTKNSQNHKSDRDAATFKAPSLPTVPKLRSGELSNGSNSLATGTNSNLCLASIGGVNFLRTWSKLLFSRAREFKAQCRVHCKR